MGKKLYGPPGMQPPLSRYLSRLTDSRMADGLPIDADWRRAACKHSPILFALYYLRDHVSMPDGSVALSEFHVEIAMAAKRWARDDVGPKEIRDAWVAPREAAKSTWLFLILTIWALAYGHRKFIVVYSDIEKTAKDHLKNLKLELSQNERLRRDFPELCEPLKIGGRPVMNDAFGYLAGSGVAIAVRGMNSATLGVKLRERRPDALFFDDIEPKEGNYSVEAKEKRLVDLVEAIFPCNLKAVVQIVGTTVMHGSIIHDIIEGKDWVDAENIEVHHFKGIIEDPVTGEERSCWPQKWTLEFLRAERANKKTRRSYAKNFENRPVAPDGTYWDDDDIVYDGSLDRFITDRILVVDPAAKSRKRNDETGIAMLGHASALGKVVVERVIGVRLKPKEARELVHSIVANNGIRVVVIDVTNGGDHVLETFGTLPNRAKIFTVNLKRSKADRFTTLHYRYQHEKVVHARPIPQLEAQQKAYPKTLHDDRIDATCLGVEYFYGELPGQTKAA